MKAAACVAHSETARNIQELLNEFKLMREESLEKERASVKVKIRKILEKLYF